MDIKEKMHSGMLYNCADEKLLSEQMGYLDKLYEFNHTCSTELKKRTELLKKL